MNNKQVSLKPKVVLESLANNRHARGDLRLFEPFPYKCNFYKSRLHLQDFDILSLKVSFGHPYSDDLINDMLLLLSFSALQPNDTHYICQVGKRYCFIKRPLISRPN